MQIHTVIVQVLLGLVFLLVGSATLTGAQPQVKEFERFSYPRWFRVVTGILEVLGGVGLLVGIWLPLLAELASIGPAVIMCGAALTHLRMKDPFQRLMPPTVLLVLLLVVQLGYWSTLTALFGKL